MSANNSGNILEGTKNNNSATFRAALLIQSWFRRTSARLEARRRSAWNAFQTLEYKNTEVTSKEIEEIFSEICHVSKESYPQEYSLKFDAPITTDDIISFLKAVNAQKRKLEVNTFKQLLSRATVIVRTQPNINYLELTDGQTVNVCGDLHGNLQALCQFIKKSKLPRDDNLYIFNGDFVDRGYKSVEVLATILLLITSYPNYVYVNRGNHEDLVVNQQYGFKREMDYKYPQSINELIPLCIDFFRHIPLACIVNNSILVCHGGISDTTALEGIKTANRAKFKSILEPCFEGPEAVDLNDWQHIMNLLWSDPQANSGCRPNNNRGAGYFFGPDVTQRFLAKSDLKAIIRAHECVPKGWALTHSNLVLTVFSSFDYHGRDSNTGAFARITGHATRPLARFDSSHVQLLECKSPARSNKEGSTSHDKNSGTFFLHVTVELIVRDDESNLGCSKNGDVDNLDVAFLKLWTFIVRYKRKLKSTFAKEHGLESDQLPVTRWCSIMSSVTGLTIDWRQLQTSLVLPVAGSDAPAKVHANSIFALPGVENPMLGNNQDIAEELLTYEYMLYEFIDLAGISSVAETGEINLPNFLQILGSMECSAKCNQLVRMTQKLCDALGNDKASRLNVGKFYAKFKFVPVAERRAVKRSERSNR